MQFRRAGIVWCCALALIGSMLGPVSACVGARPYGMGLAFVAVADDANATYWNPAGLLQLERREITFMRNMNARKWVNYQDYFAYAQPLDESSAIGISYIAKDQGIGYLGEADTWTQTWYWLSYARRLAGNTAVGINVRTINESLRLPGMSAETDLGVDVALFHRIDESATVGLLVQNANEPETTIRSASGEIIASNIQNWRPGIALHPDPTLTISASMYDALNKADGLARHIRVGVEKLVDRGESRYLVYRVGYQGLILLDAIDEAIAKGWTLGLGYGAEGFRVDAALLMHDFDDAWFLSGSYGF